VMTLFSITQNGMIHVTVFMSFIFRSSQSVRALYCIFVEDCQGKKGVNKNEMKELFSYYLSDRLYVSCPHFVSMLIG